MLTAYPQMVLGLPIAATHRLSIYLVITCTFWLPSFVGAARSASNTTETHSSGTLIDTWNLTDARCCDRQAASLVVDTRIQTVNPDTPVEEALAESWGQGVHLGVLTQSVNSSATDTYVARALHQFEGRLAGELAFVTDLDEATLQCYHQRGVRGLRIVATSLQQYSEVIQLRLHSHQFPRISQFMRKSYWHWSVKLGTEVNHKWAELLELLQGSHIPILIEMFGLPDHTKAAGQDVGTKAILAAAAAATAARSNVSKIWMQLAGPFEIDPHCTYAVPDAVRLEVCKEADRVQVPSRNTGYNRTLCCSRRTHELLKNLTEMFRHAIGDEYMVWGTHRPFSNPAVTVSGLLDAVTSWIPNEAFRSRVLGANAVRPAAVGAAPLFVLLMNKHTMPNHSFPDQTGNLPQLGCMVSRWDVKDGRCCSLPAASLVVDTHMHVWDQARHVNRGFHHSGLIEEALAEAWGVGVHLGVIAKDAFIGDNNGYMERSLAHFPRRLAGEVEFVTDFTDAELNRYHALGVRGLRLQANSLVSYVENVRRRLDSNNFHRIAQFMLNKGWHWSVQLTKEVNGQWKELLRQLQAIGAPIIVDMFGLPDPNSACGEDAGTEAIISAAAKQAPAAKIWMRLSAPYRLDPRCTYAEPVAAAPGTCPVEERVLVRKAGSTEARLLCCPPRTHKLLVDLTSLFQKVIGKNYLLWGSDWPFIGIKGVTMRGMLDAMNEWIPEDYPRRLALGTNAIRKFAVGNTTLFPFLHLPPAIPPAVRVTNIFSSLQVAARDAFMMALEDIREKMPIQAALDGEAVRSDRQNSLEQTNIACKALGPGTSAVIGPQFSSQTHNMQTILSPAGVPVLGTSATDPTLSKFPNFIRMVPSDKQQCLASSLVVEHFHWKRIASVFQEDSYGVNGLLCLLDRAGNQDGAEFLRIGIDLGADAARTSHQLQQIPDKEFKIVVANLCCYVELINTVAGAARSLGLFSTGYFWLFTDGVGNYIQSNALRNVMPDHNDIPGLWGIVAGAELAPSFLNKLQHLNSKQQDLSIYTATTYDAVWVLTYSLMEVSSAALEAISLPVDCSSDPVDIEVLRARQSATAEVVAAMKMLDFEGVSGRIAFDEKGDRKYQGFKVLVTSPGKFIGDAVTSFQAGTVDFDGHAFRLSANKLPLFLGHTNKVPSDRDPSPPYAKFSLLGVLFVVAMSVFLLMGCAVEANRFRRNSRKTGAHDSLEQSENGDVAPQARVPSFRSKLSRSMSSRIMVSRNRLPRMHTGISQMTSMTSMTSIHHGEPRTGISAANCTKPVVGDFIAGGVKSVAELANCLAFSAAITPGDLQPYLPVFLNYAIFGFIVSQVCYNLGSRYATPSRVCNISPAIFLLEVLSSAEDDLVGQANATEVTVNTLLMAATIMTFMSGVVLWLIGTLHLTKFVRFLSAPVKLGMQATLGYFLLATGVSISTGVSWLGFTSPSQFSLFLEPDTLAKWSITLACGVLSFGALCRWGWPYTIPSVIGMGVATFHIISLATGVSSEEAKGAGWLYPTPSRSNEGYNPFAFIKRIYNLEQISWPTLWRSMPAIASAAVIGPFLTAVINMVLFQTAFSAEEIGKSTLSHELRVDGLIHCLLSVVGGYSSSPSAGATAMHRKLGAKSNWGLFSAVGVHICFLLIPGSTDILQYMPKYVVGTISTIVALSMLDSGLRGAYRSLSIKEFTVVCITLVVSALWRLEAGIGCGIALSFALFIQDTAEAAPVRLDADAGLVASHAIWGVRSSRLVARLRGGVRVVCFQGFIFFPAALSALKDIESQHLQEHALVILVLDFSSCPGMDDTSPPEFKTLVAAAKKVGTFLMFSGCNPKLLVKLRKAGVFPASETITIQDEDDLATHGKEMADSSNFRVYVTSNMDEAIELAELTLALRSVHLCADVVPEPPHDMQELGKLFQTELVPHRMRLSKGEAVETKAGQLFVMLEGALEATVDVCDRRSNSFRSEATVVYRTIPGLDGDFCLSGSFRGGSLRAVSDTTLVLLQHDALDELQRMGKGPASEVIWSQMAEFMAAAMQPLALRAAMHDVNGRFSSYAAEAFEAAVADCAQNEDRCPATGGLPLEDQQEVMRRILNAEEYGGKVRDLIRKNTINFCPVLLGSLNPTEINSANLRNTTCSEPTVDVPAEQMQRTVDMDCRGGICMGTAELASAEVHKTRLSI